MHKKLFISFAILISLIFSFTICFANDGGNMVKDAADNVRNAVGGVENTVENVANNVGNNMKNNNHRSIIYNSKIIPSEYSGWAGDLVTLMGQIIKYDENKTNNELIKYGNSLIGANSTNTLFNEKDNQELILKPLDL